MKNLFMRNNIYQFRVVIPDFATIYFPQKKLLIKSLETSDKQNAIKYSKILMQKYKYIIESIKMAIDINTIKQLVNDFLSTRFYDTEKDLYNNPRPDTTVFYLMLEDMIKGYQIALNKKDFSHTKKDAQTILKQIKHYDENDFEAVSKELLEIQINHLKIIKEKIESNQYSKPNPNISLIHSQQLSIPTIHTKSKQLSTTFDEFIKNTTVTMKWTKDTIQLVTTVKKTMLLHFGDANIADIKRNDLLEFRNMLFNLQSKFLQKNHLKDKDLDFILKDSADKPKLSEETINKYMIRVNQFFNYCLENDYLQKNPAVNLKVKKNKIEAEKKRDSYTLDEVKSIKEVIKNESEEIQIITMMCMYQGMRLNEVCQLTINDIKNIDGIYCIDINTKDGKKVKTSNSIRTIPIHPSILNQVQNFISSKTDKIFSIDSKKFSEYYRKKIHPKVTSDDKKSLYSLRHNFIDSLLQNDVKIEIIASLAGHAQEYSITMNTYANKVNVKILKEAIEKVNY